MELMHSWRCDEKRVDTKNREGKGNCVTRCTSVFVPVVVLVVVVLVVAVVAAFVVSAVGFLLARLFVLVT